MQQSKPSLAHVGDWGFLNLNFTQFLGALNDNLYKWLLVYLLISIQGSENANIVLSISGAIFVLPFVFMSSICGKLADNYSKTLILRLAKVLEIFIMGAGVIAFSFASEWGSYFVLFLMAMHSTLFSPAKYGILPEIFPREEVPVANGWLSLFTNIAIIMGSFLAAWITDITGHNFQIAGFVCMGIAVIGSISSLAIPRSPSSAQNKRLHLSFWKEVFKSLKLAKNIPYLRTVLVGNSLFFAVAAYCQLNVVTYAMVNMGLSKTAGGYLFPAMAIGIGVGSMFAGKASRGIPRLHFLWKGALGVALCFLSLFFTSTSIAATSLVLFLLGFFGGFYIVPTDSFVQMRTPDEHRGEMIGTANVLAFLGVMTGSALIYLIGDVLKLSPKEGFVCVGVLSILLGVCLKRALKNYREAI